MEIQSNHPLRKLISRNKLTPTIGLIFIVSIVFSYLLAEKLLGGNLLMHIFKETYWYYEIGFFVTLSVSYFAMARLTNSLVILLLSGGLLGYAASFVFYHLSLLLFGTSDAWIEAVQMHPILWVFAPSCLIAVVVGLMFAICVEVGMTLVKYSSRS